jgi:hypothetical protein
MTFTRVPCPGGNAACTGGGAVRESSWSAVTAGGLVSTGCGGADGGAAVTLEILIKQSFLSCDRIVRGSGQRVVNPLVQSVSIAANPAQR